MTNDTADTVATGSGVELRAFLHSNATRTLAGLLTATSRVGPLVILSLLFLSDGPVNPLRLIRLMIALCLVPEIAATILRRDMRTSISVGSGTVVLYHPSRRAEVPVASVAGIEPWLIPLPGSGVGLRLQSGRRWPDEIEIADPTALVEAIVDQGGRPSLLEATNHPSMVFAHARARVRSGTWWGALLKFPLFAILPTIPLFRVHQIIAYGSGVGEYYQYGLGAYLAGFAIYWATLTIYLIAYAAAIRVPLELAAIASSVTMPTQAARVRCTLERIAALLYYGGVPLAVGLRFLA